MDQSYLTSSRKQFEYYKLLGDKTFEQLTDEQLLWQPNEECNSVATIVKHLWGNMLSRWTDFLTTDGEKEWRQRDAEFDNDISTREEMLAKWEAGWACLFAAFDSLSESDLGRIIYIRNQGHTVMEAINRQLAHYPYHVGQIVQLGKLIRSTEWNSLSIPRGGSSAFNSEKFSKPQHKAHFTDEMLAPATDLNSLRDNLMKSHQILWKTVEGLSDEQKGRAEAGKWNALQHLAHIHLSVEALGRFLASPKNILLEKFGSADRPSLDYPSLKTKYETRLSQGVVQPDRFAPPALAPSDFAGMAEQGRAILAQLLKALEGWSEDEVDRQMCPHPALGLLTTREMLMFTVIHAEHHTRSILQITA